MQRSEKIEKNAESIEEKAKREGIFAKLKTQLREKDEREVRKRLQKVVSFMLTVAAAWLLSGTELFFGTYPLGVALICSARRHLPAVVLGVVIAAFSGMPAVYVYICFAVLMVRVLGVLLPMIFSDFAKEVREDSGAVIQYDPKALAEIEEPERNVISDCLGRIFCEDLAVKMICSAVGGIIGGIYLLLQSEFSFYSLCATLVMTSLAPVAVLLFGGIWGEERYKREWYSLISLGAVILICVLGARDRSILGMPMAPFLAMLFTLYVSSDKGILCGCAAALLCGAVFEPIYIPLLLLSAVLFCLISAVRRNAGIAVVCGLIVVWCYYIGGEGGLIKVLPPMFLSLPVYVLADKYREMMKAPYRKAELTSGVYFAEAITEKTKNEAVKERLAALSEAFSSLSETFYKLSDRFRRPDVLGLRRITDSAVEKVCEGCRNRERCWGADYADTLEAIKCITSGLHTKGAAELNDLPQRFVSGCIRCERLIEEVNTAVSQTTERIMKGGKASLFASNYDDITAILRDALNSDSDEYECDMEAGGRIFDLLYEEGLSVGGVVVYGKRCRHVVAKGIALSDGLSAERAGALCRRISEIVGSDLSEPVFEVGKDGTVMLLYSRPTVKVNCAHGRLSRTGKEWSSHGEEGDGKEDFIAVDPFEEDGEEACGDMTDAFITDNSYFYALISDGMGSGEEAAYTSGVCAMFIEKMLSAGNRADITLRMLNNVIRSENMGCGSECSATVDLMELDLMNGTASFIKSGAAPTYIAREGTVYKVSSRTMPIGIIKDADARITKFDTKKGDIIVMMSDGCCHDSEDCSWLVEYLCGYMMRSKKAVSVGEELCEKLKEEILREAVKNVPEGEERDDISVSVTVVG